MLPHSDISKTLNDLLKTNLIELPELKHLEEAN
jgi:hypothetical protein